VAPLVVLAALATASVLSAREASAGLEAAYQRGLTALAASDPLSASAAFAAAGSHRDAPARFAAADAALQPLRANADDGAAALARGEYEAAIDLLLPVARQAPALGEVAERLSDARAGLADQLGREADAAEARRDWLEAERLLSRLAAADPANDRAQLRLAENISRHGPLVVGMERDLWLVGPDGADARPLTQGVQALWPVWNPERSAVAFLSVDPQDPSGEVYLMVVRPGETPRELARSVSAHAPAVWSPDGATLAYTSFAAFDPIGRSGPISVRTVEVETGRETDVTRSRFQLAFNPVFSPDGARLAFVAKEPQFEERPQHAPGDVWLTDLAGDSFDNLTDGAISDVWSVHWQPGGNLLLLYSLYGQSWYEPPQSALRLIDPASGASEVIATGSPDPLGPPAWSPDGQRFAWVSGDRTLVMRDGPMEREWETESSLSNDLTWAPDGSAVLAAALEGDRPSALLRLDPTSGARNAVMTEVTIAYDSQQPFVGPPQWSSPGAAVPFVGAAVAGAGLDADP
jgi:Tol biopolymer transport system component